MRRWYTLVLMEQQVMVLVFALAAALCLQAFALANRISQDNAVRAQAMLHAETAAETMKNCRGDGARAAALAGGTWNPSPEGTTECGSWHISYDENWAETRGDAAYVTEAIVRQQNPYLGEAVVLVQDADGKTAAELTVRWQMGGTGNA